jgi:hypothetical protein
MTMQRLLAVLLWWLAVLLFVAGGLTKIIGLVDLPLSVWVGGSLMALGLNVLVAGDLVVTIPSSKPFNARAQVSRAVLDATSVWADVEVRAGADYERLAAIRMEASTRPKLKVVEGVAHLGLSRRLRWLPGEADWRATLATHVLWDVRAHSTLGDVDVDLRGLRVDRVSLKSTLGSGRIVCPQRGRPVVEVETLLGDLEVMLPPEVGARVRVAGGRFANVSLDEEHFEQINATTFATHDLEPTDAAVEITLRIQAGEARIGRI